MVVTPDLRSFSDSTVKRLIKQCGGIEEVGAAQAHVLVTTDSNIGAALQHCLWRAGSQLQRR